MLSETFERNEDGARAITTYLQYLTRESDAELRNSCHQVGCADKGEVAHLFVYTVNGTEVTYQETDFHGSFTLKVEGKDSDVLMEELKAATQVQRYQMNHGQGSLVLAIDTLRNVYGERAHEEIIEGKISVSEEEGTKIGLLNYQPGTPSFGNQERYVLLVLTAPGTEIAGSYLGRNFEIDMETMVDLFKVTERRMSDAAEVLMQNTTDMEPISSFPITLEEITSS